MCWAENGRALVGRSLKNWPGAFEKVSRGQCAAGRQVSNSLQRLSNWYAANVSLFCGLGLFYAALGLFWRRGPEGRELDFFCQAVGREFGMLAGAAGRGLPEKIHASVQLCLLVFSGVLQLQCRKELRGNVFVALSGTLQC